MAVNRDPSAPAPGPRKGFLSRKEAAQALNVKPWRVLEFEKSGELHPHRDANGARRYARSEVVALATKLAIVAPRAGALEAQILEAFDAGKSDAEIVKALHVPLASVRALRAAAAGDVDEPSAHDSAARIATTAAERAFLHQAEADLEADRARIFATIERRRKESNR